MKTQKNRFVLALIVIIVTGCALNKNLKSPQIEVPKSYAYSEGIADSSINIEWTSVFKDTTLTRLISMALSNNKNLEAAISKVEQAKLNMKMTRSALFPSLGYSLKGGYGNESSFGRSKNIQDYDLSASVSWEIDIFGKIRYATESTKAQILKTDYARKGIALSLITQVASTYFNMLSYEQSWLFSMSEYNSRLESQNLIEASFAAGEVSNLDVQQAKQLTLSAAIAIPQYLNAMKSSLNTLCSLVGIMPNKNLITRSALLSDRVVEEDIPVGLPIQLLERRPDIMEAYYNIVSDKALVGVAQAMRLPSLTLTGEGGLINSDFSNLFKSGSLVWSTLAAITGPIFQFGKNKRNVEIAKEQFIQSVLGYEQTVIDAVTDVENSILTVNMYKQQVVDYEKMVESATISRKLASERYLKGISSFIEVQDAERTFFETEISYYQAMANKLTAIANLYKSLGGGYQENYLTTK